MGLGPWHMLIVLIIVLVVFGPTRLPGLGKSMGEAIRGFKKGLEGTNDEIDVTNTARRESLNTSGKETVNETAQQQPHKEKSRTDA